MTADDRYQPAPKDLHHASAGRRRAAGRRGVSFTVAARRVRGAGGSLGRRQILDPEDDLGNYRCDGGRIGSGTRALWSTSPRRAAADLGVRRADHRLCQPVPAGRAAGADPRRGGRAADRDRHGARRRRASGPARCCAVSTFRSGCGRCRPRPSPAASSSGSISRAASLPTCRSCCSTSRPLRSMPPTARSWSS